MLQELRDNSQGVIAKVIIGLIIAVFALFGVESIIGGFVTLPPVAQVNGEEINETQLQASTQNLLSSIGGDIGSLDQTLLEQIALNQIIEEVILRQLAEKQSMLISSDRIDRSIVDNPQFQIGGAFDSDLAVRTLASQGYSVPVYRESLNQQLILSQVASAYTSSNFVTEAELDRAAALTAQTRDFRYLSIPMGTRTLGTPISDEQIKTYYDEHRDDFTVEETVVLNYVLLDQDVLAEEIVVDESEVTAQYEIERSAFEGSAEKRASHILFELGTIRTETQALELAAATRQRLLNGEDFGALALEFSSDVVSAEDGGDIGFTDGTAFPPEIETALETLALNEISAPVISEFGVHLVKLTQDSENVFQPIEAVAERIERELKRSRVELLYAERLADLSNLAFESGDLESISTELNLVILQSEPINRSGNSGIFSNAAVIAAAFADEVLLEGNNSDVIEISPSQAAVIHVQEFNEASVLSLEEVEPEIAVLLRTDMERGAVQELGQQLLTAVETGASIDEILTINELEWIDQTAIGRNAATVNREVIAKVFALPNPQGTPERSGMILDNGTYILIELNQVTPGSLVTLADDARTAMSESILSDLGNSDFQAFLSNLRDSADIQTRAVDEEF